MDSIIINMEYMKEIWEKLQDSFSVKKRDRDDVYIQTLLAKYKVICFSQNNLSTAIDKLNKISGLVTRIYF